MRHPINRIGLLLATACLAHAAFAADVTAPPAVAPAGAAAPATAPATAAATQPNPAALVAAPFADLAGSPENAVALANALRTATPVTLTAKDGAEAAATTIVPATRAMGWGSVSYALEFARFVLARAGITQPTPAELKAALLGGSVAVARGSTATLAGVLKQRAAGMDWRSIARSYGTTTSAVVRAQPSPTSSSADPGKGRHVVAAGSTNGSLETVSARTSAGTATREGIPGRW